MVWNFRSLATALINMSFHSQCLQKFLTPILNYFTYFTCFTYLHAKVFSVQFSHDSTLLLTASMDGSARTCRLNVAVWFLWGRPNGMGQGIGQTDATLPGFPTFRRVKTRSSSQAKISRFRCDLWDLCGTCGTSVGPQRRSHGLVAVCGFLTRQPQSHSPNVDEVDEYGTRGSS